MTSFSRMSQAKVGNWIQEYIKSSNNPDLRQYGSLVLEVLHRFLWETQYIMDLGGMYDRHILEIGCGFGWGAVAVSMLGNNRVVASDIRDTMTTAVQERVDTLKRKGMRVNVEVLLADICNIEIPAEQFDAILCQEAIEHIHDLEAMFANCALLLRPGGHLVIQNDANVLNRKELDEMKAMWEKRDRSWDYIDQLKKERPIENRDIKPYAIMREEIVRRAKPSLSLESVSQIVDATAGLRESEIDRVAKAYYPQMQLPRPPEFSWCRNPVTGEYCERLLDPFEVSENLRAHGFETRVFHSFRRLPLRLLNGVRLRFLSRWLFSLRPSFIICAVRC